MPEVSILIPLYGRRRGCALLAIVAAWLDQTLETEIIIATDSILPVEVASVSHAVHILHTDSLSGAPGLLRNLAAQHSHAPILYLSDADILPLGSDFLTRAMALADGRVVGQPWMYRLADSARVSKTLRYEAPGPGTHCFVYADIEGFLHPAGGERFRWYQNTDTGASTEILAVFPPAGNRSPGASSRQQWLAPFHWGGLLLSRQIFEEVGGYCQRYQGWGFEDDDLLVKIADRYPVVRAWRTEPTLSCLHFEHPRQRLDAEETKVNATRFTERVAAGAASMIADDISDAQKSGHPPAQHHPCGSDRADSDGI